MLITTKGCEACDIMKNNILEALVSTTKDISVEVKDREDVSKEELKRLNVTDFPTILFYNNDVLKYKYSGTRPTVVILRWIDIYLT